MYASIQRGQLLSSWFFRCCARASGVAIFLGWLCAVVSELFLTGLPVKENYLQVVPVAAIFAGYAIGWRKELLGGMLAVFGAMASVWVDAAVLGNAVTGMLWFAVPGIFYLLAHYLDNAHVALQE
jgi:hypothetical protein